MSAITKLGCLISNEVSMLYTLIGIQIMGDVLCLWDSIYASRDSVNFDSVGMEHLFQNKLFDLRHGSSEQTGRGFIRL